MAYVVEILVGKEVLVYFGLLSLVRIGALPPSAL